MSIHLADPKSPYFPSQLEPAQKWANVSKLLHNVKDSTIFKPGYLVLIATH